MMVRTSACTCTKHDLAYTMLDRSACDNWQADCKLCDTSVMQVYDARARDIQAWLHANSYSCRHVCLTGKRMTDVEGKGSAHTLT